MENHDSWFFNYPEIIIAVYVLLSSPFDNKYSFPTPPERTKHVRVARMCEVWLEVVGFLFCRNSFLIIPQLQMFNFSFEVLEWSGGKE